MKDFGLIIGVCFITIASYMIGHKIGFGFWGRFGLNMFFMWGIVLISSNWEDSK